MFLSRLEGEKDGVWFCVRGFEVGDSLQKYINVYGLVQGI